MRTDAVSDARKHCWTREKGRRGGVQVAGNLPFVVIFF